MAESPRSHTTTVPVQVADDIGQLGSASADQASGASRHYQRLTARSIGFAVGRHVGFVPENSLCTGCGTCEAVCPEHAVTMELDRDKGIYHPAIHESLCTECERCVMTCPGFELDLATDRDAARDVSCHNLIGPYVSIWRAFTVNDSVRGAGASGGMITETLDYLLSTGRVTGAIVTRGHPDSALENLSYIARTSNDLIPSQGSRYCPGPLNTILGQFVRNEVEDGPYAFVGLPSHVHGLRLLQRLHPQLLRRFSYVISPFTAHVPSRRATEFILYKHGLRSEEVAEVQYRGGGVPGRMRITLHDGSVRLVPHLHWMYYGHTFPYFFYPVREWLHFDKLCEWSDFSMGDNWQLWGDETRGASTVVARTEAADRVVRAMVDCGLIQATPMTADELVDDQHLTTKLCVEKRIRVWRLLGRSVPIYPREHPRDPNGLVRTSLFAGFVLLSERSLPFRVMNWTILSDWVLRKRLPAILRAVVFRLKAWIRSGGTS